MNIDMPAVLLLGCVYGAVAVAIIVLALIVVKGDE